MKQHGYALVLTLIIMVPIIIFVISTLDAVTTDYKVVWNNINAQQSYYNAEAGILYAKNKLGPSKSKIKNQVYYLYMKDGSIKHEIYSPNRNDYICVEIHRGRDRKENTFRIISESNYFGFKQKLAQNIVFEN